jgi:hypothetical protein
MREADERFAERLARDLAPYLGPQLELQGIELSDPEGYPARIRATCVFDGGLEVLVAYGETRLEAYNQLILRAAQLRLIVASRGLDSEELAGLAEAWKAGFSQSPR